MIGVVGGGDRGRGGKREGKGRKVIEQFVVG